MMPATTPPSADVHQAALDLAAHGFRVLPIRPGMKHPPMAAWQQAATTRTEAIGAWWNGLYRGHGVGIATGHLDTGEGFFVLDIDERDTFSGTDALHDLEKVHGPLPATITSITGSGSEHRYLLVPAGRPVPRNDQSGRLGAGLDIRGEGGQVVVAPTVHPNGNAYAWEVGHAPGEIDMAEAPAWLMDLLAPVERSAPAPAPTRQRDVFLSSSPADRWNDRTTWPDLLERDGWQLHHIDADGEQHWTRPGKDRREGTSATVGWQGNDALKVFTSAVPWLQAERTYSRFQYEAARTHGGDERALARQIIADEGAAVVAALPVVPVGTEPPASDEMSDYDASLRGLLLDWGDFWAKDTTEASWLAEPVIAQGRATALFAPGGTGKSLFALWLCASIACGLIGLDGMTLQRRRVLYLDYEMTADDLAERLTAMGFSAEMDLGWLHYALLPSLPPADAPEGGKAIARLAQLVGADLVVIDTFGRAVAGDENDADTVRNFYRWTGLHLKAEGRAFLRVDHAGKDVEKGQRGTSAKNDDVDVVWRMMKADGGFTLKATKRRMGWVPEEVVLMQRDEPQLHYRTGIDAVPAGTAETVADLDALGVAVDASARKAAEALRAAGRSAKNDRIRAAQKARRSRVMQPVDNYPESAPRTSGRGRETERAPIIGAHRGALDETPGQDVGRGAGRGGARYPDATGARAPSLEGARPSVSPGKTIPSMDDF